MEIDPKCGTILKLKEMCLRKCAIYLWDNVKIFDSELKCYQEEPSEEDSGESVEDWQARTEPVLKRKVKELENENLIIASLGQQITELIRPVGYQIKCWLDFQQYNIRNTKSISWPESTNIIWKPNNTINYSETAKKVIDSGRLSDIQCYKIACVNCLEDIIPNLWHKLPEEKKLSFVKRSRSDLFSLTLEDLWPFIIHEKVSCLDSLWEQSNRHYTSFYQWAFEYFARRGFLVPAKYFYTKMTAEQREESVLRAAEDLLTNNQEIEEVGFQPFLFYYFGREMEAETFCWLYTVMNARERRDVFYNHAPEVLSNFLYFPWPDFFMENIELSWNIISPDNYTTLISTFARRLRSNSNHYFKEFIIKCFVESPPAFRKCVVTEEDIPFSSGYLILIRLSEDLESLQMFLKCLEEEDRKSLFLQDGVLGLFCDCILEDKSAFVKECLLTVELSNEEREQFEEEFHRFIERQQYEDDEYEKLEKLFDFLK